MQPYNMMNVSFRNFLETNWQYLKSIKMKIQIIRGLQLIDEYKNSVVISSTRLEIPKSNIGVTSYIDL